MHRRSKKLDKFALEKRLNLCVDRRLDDLQWNGLVAATVMYIQAFPD
jgi:hypothetical protein